MKIRALCMVAGAALSLLSGTTTAQAALTFDWDFLPHGKAYYPEDTVDLYVTFRNQPWSDGNVTAAHIGGANVYSNPGSIIGTTPDGQPLYIEQQYAFTSALPSSASGLDLAPGEETKLYFGSLVPRDGTADVGDYVTDGGRIEPLGAAYYHDDTHPLSFQVQPVPEPGSVVLMGMGLLSLVEVGRRRSL